MKCNHDWLDRERAGLGAMGTRCELCDRTAIEEAAQLLRECVGVMETEGFDGEVKRINAWLALQESGDAG